MISKIEYIKEALIRLRRKKFIVLESKKSQRKKLIFVKDGFINYKVEYDSDRLKCQCGRDQNGYCDHIVHLLSHFFRYSERAICFLDTPEIYKFFLDGIRSNKRKTEPELLSRIDTFLEGEDCPICLYALGDKVFNLDLYQCKMCKKYVHSKCMNRWLSTRRGLENIKGCVLCRSQVMGDKNSIIF